MMPLVIRITHLLSIAHLIVSMSGFPEDVYKTEYRWTEEGDINIGAIMSIHSSNSLLNCTDKVQDVRNVQNVEALSFAIREINDRQDILPNLTLGFDILDDCLSPSIALARGIQFMPRGIRVKKAESTDRNFTRADEKFDDDHTFYDVIGVIGAYTSKLSIVVANVLSLFNLPQISHTATSDVLSDKDRFPYFFRMVPPDRYQAKTIASILHRFNWSHVSIVHSEGSYGRDGVKELQDTFHAIKNGVCIEDTIEINYDSKADDFLKILDTLKSHADTRVVVAFVEIADAMALGKAIVVAGLVGRFVWVGSDSFSLILEESPDKCNTFPGSISVHPYASKHMVFGEHLKKLYNATDRQNISLNPWIDELFDDMHYTDNFVANSHSAKRCMLHRKKNKVEPSFVDSFLIDSVYAFAHALDKVRSENCSPQMMDTGQIADCISRIGIYNELKTINFNGSSGQLEFNEDGDVMTKYEVHQCFASTTENPKAELRSVGFWYMEDESLNVAFENLVWNRTNVPFSACPKPCTDTVGSYYYFMKQTCCHVCRTCKVNEIVSENATSCEMCPEMFWPDDQTRKSCVKIPPFFFGLQNAMSIGLCAVAIAGVVTCIWITVTLVKYREEHVVKCFSIELSGIIILGTLMTYCLTGSFLSQPNSLKCYINHVGFSLTFTIIYAPLLVKTNRIYRIFNSGKRTTRKPCFISSSSQVIIALFLIFCQIAIVIISTSIDPPEVMLHMPQRTEKFVELFCNLPRAGLLSSLSYNLVLVVICTFYAFKTRKLPDNYKESRYIAFCVDTTLLIWITFVPTYFTTSRAAAKTTILAISLLLNASVTVTCLFIPRITSLFRSLKNKCSMSGHHYKDFRIVKHVVKRKRSTDLQQTTPETDTSRRISSALTIQSDVSQDAILTVKNMSAGSLELSCLSEINQEL